MGVYSLEKLLAEARKLAVEYRKATGQPLAITSELAKQDAARLLDLDPAPPATGGYDAVGRHGERAGRRFQVKGRAILDEGRGGQRIGQLRLDQPWDSVLLVLMDEAFEPTEIWEAERPALLAALAEGGESKRAKRGAMSVARFKAIGRLVWLCDEGEITDELWENHP